MRLRWILMAVLFGSAPMGARAQQPPATPAAQAASPQVALPDADKIVLLARTALLTLNDAVQTGNFTVLRDKASPNFQAANTAARLGMIFQNLSRQGVDLSAISIIVPQLTQKPIIDTNGRLRLKGYFPGTPVRIDFDLLFEVCRRPLAPLRHRGRPRDHRRARRRADQVGYAGQSSSAETESGRPEEIGLRASDLDLWGRIGQSGAMSDRRTKKKRKAPPAAEAAPFWETKTLEEMSRAEWESLCDGCAQCCLVKIEDEDTANVYVTRLACKLLDIGSCRCSDYANRHASEPDCIKFSAKNVTKFSWLPESCAYRRLSEGRGTRLVASARLGRSRDGARRGRIGEKLGAQREGRA